jgi:enoyl-[acyl-carrier protein] reductase II
MGPADNPVVAMLGCPYPIIQGAMGVICNPELVAAVSEAGGFGLLATAFAADPELVRAQVRATHRLTDKPFGANLQMMNPLSPRFAEVLAEEGVRAVTVSAGSPRAILGLLKELGMKVMAVVPTAEVARKSEELGVDAVIAEGLESGGLQGARGAATMVLVPAVADAVKIPVIAAGGIADARGYRAALALGAAGVQVGTRFIATKECIAHAKYKQLILDSAETGTQVLDLGGIRARLLTATVARTPRQGAAPAFGGGVEALEDAWIRGNLEGTSLSAGEVCGLINKVVDVREVIEEMVR